MLLLILHVNAVNASNLACSSVKHNAYFRIKSIEKSNVSYRENVLINFWTLGNVSEIFWNIVVSEVSEDKGML